MADDIYVDPSAATANVIEVGGRFYKRVGLSSETPTVFSGDIDSTASECKDCRCDLWSVAWSCDDSEFGDVTMVSEDVSCDAQDVPNDAAWHYIDQTMGSCNYHILLAHGSATPSPPAVGCDCNCEYISEGTITTNALNHDISYFSSGASLPAGKYKVVYVEGAYETGYTPPHSWLVYSGLIHSNGSVDEGVVIDPSVTIWYDEAAAEAGTAGQFFDFSHSGGTIGMYNADPDQTTNTNGSPRETFELFYCGELDAP